MIVASHMFALSVGGEVHFASSTQLSLLRSHSPSMLYLALQVLIELPDK